MSTNDEATQRKLRECEERRASWMRQRQAHIEKSSVEAELRQEQALAAGLMRGSSSEEMPVTTEIKQGRISEGGRCLLADAHHFKPEDIVTLLTERITDRLRDELRTELQNETSRAAAAQKAESGKLEGYLASEIESHTCPICYELMVPPVHQPILLFPCGHSFCHRCIALHTSTHGKNTCPFCRQIISSKAPNMALQQLIQNFVAKKGKIRSDEAAFEPCAAGNASGRDQERKPSGLDDGGDDSTRWGREHRMLDMRCRVLQNELADTIQERQKCRGNMDSARVVLNVFLEEERKAKAKLEAAQREMELVQSQVEGQSHKIVSYSSQFAELEAKIDLIQRTLQPLEAEKDKLQLLLSNCK